MILRPRTSVLGRTIHYCRLPGTTGSFVIPGPHTNARSTARSDNIGVIRRAFAYYTKHVKAQEDDALDQSLGGLWRALDADADGEVSLNELVQGYSSTRYAKPR